MTGGQRVVRDYPVWPGAICAPGGQVLPCAADDARQDLTPTEGKT